MSIDQRPIVSVALVLALTSVASAQAPAPAASQPAPVAAPAPAAPGATAPPMVSLPTPPPNYAYAVDARRDPFVSLINRGTEGRGATGSPVKKAEGIAGLQTAEIVVRGIVQSRGVWAAMVLGPDKKMYTIRAGDRLLDGVVRAVTAQAVVILQEVNDPLSLDKQREVRKFLRGGEEVK